MTEPEEQEVQEHKQLGNYFIIATFFLLMVLIYFLFANILENDYNPNQGNLVVQSDGRSEVVLKRNIHGSYVTSGKINNQKVTFLVDTGASDVSVPYKLAKKLNLEFGPEQKYWTANGTITSNLTTLYKVRIGNIELKNVRASINPKMERDQILLGMSFLKRIEFSQRGKTLILRK